MKIVKYHQLGEEGHMASAILDRHFKLLPKPPLVLVWSGIFRILGTPATWIIKKESKQANQLILFIRDDDD